MADSKRLNFDITPEQEAELTALRETMGTSSAKDTVLRAIRVLRLLSAETSRGAQIYVRTPAGEEARLLIPELDPGAPEWMYLVVRPHPWRRQLHVKGRRLLASTVWGDMLAEGMNPEEGAENWSLPVECVREIVAYCEANRALLEMEASEERRRLEADGVKLGSPPVH